MAGPPEAGPAILASPVEGGAYGAVTQIAHAVTLQLEVVLSSSNVETCQMRASAGRFS
jgi:hypothetical protein